MTSMQPIAKLFVIGFLFGYAIKNYYYSYIKDKRNIITNIVVFYICC